MCLCELLLCPFNAHSPTHSLIHSLTSLSHCLSEPTRSPSLVSRCLMDLDDLSSNTSRMCCITSGSCWCVSYSCRSVLSSVNQAPVCHKPISTLSTSAAKVVSSKCMCCSGLTIR